MKLNKLLLIVALVVVAAPMAAQGATGRNTASETTGIFCEGLSVKSAGGSVAVAAPESDAAEADKGKSAQ